MGLIRILRNHRGWAILTLGLGFTSLGSGCMPKTATGAP
jgi:hypothetical protein